ncbi:EamA family transporter [Paratractidigestivibacter sp.]|uniref:EamA family transporter n=1 Tax=Paratractidigestivibacter sp. TaxID=2847316 RepID=UPI003A91FFA2
MDWVLAAAASALFAGATSILAKIGIEHTDSDVATAIRTTVVLVFSWVMTAISVGDVPAALAAITPRSYLFLGLSGLATGASWICYFAALSEGDVNKVVPIDKSSTALSVLLAIVLFGETSHLAVKLVATAVILGGTFLMIERKKGSGARSAGAGSGANSGSANALADAPADGSVCVPADGSADAPADGGRRWLVLAVLSAVFAALTSVLAKVGIEHVDSSLATAVRTCFVLVMAWVIVAARGKLGLARDVDRRELAFICASGVATGASWLFYYYAVQTGQVSVVVQIDKLSILVSIAFARAVLDERLSRRAAVGLVLIVAATLAMTVWA